MDESKKQEAVVSKPLPSVEIRRGAYARLTIYDVEESELELLAQGSPVSLYLNFSIFLLSTAISFLTALLTLPDNQSAEASKRFIVFVVITAVGFVAGIFLLFLWLKQRKSTSELVMRIKNRLPPEGIQENTIPDNTSL